MIPSHVTELIEEYKNGDNFGLSLAELRGILWVLECKQVNAHSVHEIARAIKETIE